LLKREGLVVNHKRTERLYQEEGLALRKKRRRKGAAGVRVILPSPQRKATRGAPCFIRVDNGPEFISKELDRWAYENRTGRENR
jgi:transposase InsO family protein